MGNYATLFFLLHVVLSATSTVSRTTGRHWVASGVDNNSEGPTVLAHSKQKKGLMRAAEHSSLAEKGPLHQQPVESHGRRRDPARTARLGRRVGKMSGPSLTNARAPSPSKLLVAEVRAKHSKTSMESMAIEDMVDSDDDSGDDMKDTDDPYWMAHNASTSGFLVVSGAGGRRNPVDNTITYEPEVWNSDTKIQASHNCFMYALNDINDDVRQACARAQQGTQTKTTSADYRRLCRKYFHKPGYYFQRHVLGLNQIDQWTRPFTTCNYMMPLLFSDNPSSSVWSNSKSGRALTEYDECPNKHYMAALVVDPNKGFHFYRRDHACTAPANKGKTCWSHKPGITKATKKDASGHEIVSLERANRVYGQTNYKQLCGVFCVPFNGIRQTHSGNKWSR